jgi:hypothetical protein
MHIYFIFRFRAVLVGLGPLRGWTATGGKGAREIVFFYYGQKNIFVDAHVSGNSKTFSPL